MPSEPDPPRPHLLVVDDDKLMRETVGRGLTQAGFDVAEAAEGDEALRRLSDRPADVVIVDIFMPRKDGIELIREVRRKWPGTRILAMSGGNRFFQQDMLAAARALGADASLDKPFMPSDLIATVRRLLTED